MTRIILIGITVLNAALVARSIWQLKKIYRFQPLPFWRLFVYAFGMKESVFLILLIAAILGTASLIGLGGWIFAVDWTCANAIFAFCWTALRKEFERNK